MTSEQILLAIRPHLLALFSGLVWCAILIFLPWWWWQAFSIAHFANQDNIVAASNFLTVYYLAICFLTWWSVWLWLNTRVYFTDRRLIIKHARRTGYLNYGDIAKIETEYSSVFHYWFGYGNLLVRRAEGQLKLKSLFRPERIKEFLAKRSIGHAGETIQAGELTEGIAVYL